MRVCVCTSVRALVCVCAPHEEVCVCALHEDDIQMSDHIFQKQQKRNTARTNVLQHKCAHRKSDTYSKKHICNTCTRTRAHVLSHTHTQTRAHTHTNTHTHARTRTHKHIHTHTHVHTHTHTYHSMQSTHKTWSLSLSLVSSSLPYLASSPIGRRSDSPSYLTLSFSPSYFTLLTQYTDFLDPWRTSRPSQFMSQKYQIPFSQQVIVYFVFDATS